MNGRDSEASSHFNRARSDLLRRDRAHRTRNLELASADRITTRLRNNLLPALKLVDRPLASLRAPGRNVRSIEPGHVRSVSNAISELGFTVPLLIDQDGGVLDGVVRMEAAKLLGLSSVPCIIVDHLSPNEQKLLRIAINRLGERGAWGFDELKIELKKLIVNEMPVEITGFEVAEIDSILALDQEPTEEGDLEPPAEEPAVARPGDIFVCGPHRVACGDVKDPGLMRRLMGEDVVRIVFTDQPYNVQVRGHVTSGRHREFAEASGEMSETEFSAFNRAWVESVIPYIVDGGLLGIFIDWRGLGSVSAAVLEMGLTQINLIVWAKTNAGMGSLYRSQHELLPLFKKGSKPHLNNIDLGRKGRWRSNLWRYAGASSLGSDARRGLRHHPTVKPVGMIVDALSDLTNRGEIVLAPFLGSGSTLIAAHKAGQICRGLDIDPLYVDLAVRRFEQVPVCVDVCLALSAEPPLIPLRHHAIQVGAGRPRRAPPSA